MDRAKFMTATGFCRSLWPVLLAISPVLSGCGAQGTKLDSSLVSKYNLKDEDFKQLQYYLAADLVLSRQVSKEEKRERVKGKLVERKGEVSDEVMIRAGTPGVCLKSTGYNLEISFEQGTSITFYKSTMYGYIPQTNSGYIEFSGNRYKVQGEFDAYLQVGVESLEKAERQRKTLGGRKLDP